MKASTRALLTHPASAVWLGLVLATGLSWKMGSAASATGDHRYLMVALIGVALIKIRFVMRHFMEVKWAGVLLRRLTDAWLVGVGVAILTLYWRAL